MVSENLPQSERLQSPDSHQKLGQELGLITDKWMQRRPARADRWASDEAPRGAGRFVARITQNGERLFYFRYMNGEGKQARHPIGFYDRSGSGGGLTLSSARHRFGELSKLYGTGVRDIREFEKLRIRAEMTARQAAEEARRRTELAASAGSLQALLQAYWQHLERHGKASAADVRRLLTRHVIEAHPVLAARQVAELRGRDFRPALARLVEEGKGRTADKVRSFIRSACQLALRSDMDASLPAEFQNFALESNPAAAIPAMPQYNRVGERSLTEPELREYLHALDALANPVVKAALSAALYLGGQRARQLLRVKPSDIDLHGRVIRLLDPKGRRVQARLHELPLTDRTVEILQPLVKQNGETPFVFTKDGNRPCSPDTLSNAVSLIAGALLAQKRVGSDFDYRDLRRTCETHMARLGVISDHRSQVQSHGLGGVQNRHYDRHDYMAEKRAALERWEAYLDSVRVGRSLGNIVPMIRRA